MFLRDTALQICTGSMLSSFEVSHAGLVTKALDILEDEYFAQGSENLKKICESIFEKFEVEVLKPRNFAKTKEFSNVVEK